MKIESKDASVTNIKGNITEDKAKINVPKEEVKEVQPVDSSLESKGIIHLSDYEKKELKISEKLVIDAIEKANKAALGASTKFEFSIHEKTKQIMVKIIDSDTNKVIREIPPEKTLDMVARMWEMAGIIVDERR